MVSGINFYCITSFLGLELCGQFSNASDGMPPCLVFQLSHNLWLQKSSSKVWNCLQKQFFLILVQAKGNSLLLQFSFVASYFGHLVLLIAKRENLNGMFKINEAEIGTSTPR